MEQGPEQEQSPADAGDGGDAMGQAETETGPETAAEASVTSGVGTLLRASRERIGQDLRDVSSILRIRFPYLQAIEEGRHGDLPGAAYAIGFVRAYAEHLGLDSEEIVRRYKAETADAAKKTELVFPTTVSESVMPGGAMVFIGVLLAAVAYGAWYMSTSTDDTQAEAVPTLPDRLTEMLNKPVDEAEKETKTVSTQAKEANVAATSEEAEKPAADMTPQAAETAPTEAEAPAPEPAVEETAPVAVQENVEQAQADATAATDAAGETVEETTEAVEEAVVEETTSEDAAEAATEVATQAVQEAAAPTGPKIQVRAKQASWIQIRDEDAKIQIMTRLLRKGDVYDVPARTGLSLVTGNAGALEILVDGNVVPALGDAGAVRRRVLLDAEKLLDGSAVSE